MVRYEIPSMNDGGEFDSEEDELLNILQWEKEYIDELDREHYLKMDELFRSIESR